MSMNFPADPELGQQYPTVNPVWEYNGTAWDAIGGSGVPSTATPVTRRLADIDGNVDFIGLDGTGPALVSASVIAEFAGAPPAASRPAVMTVGQWTVLAIAGGLRFDLDAEPNDGGSPITGYQYSLNNGSTWTAFAGGAALGIRDITGLPETEAQTRVRAVNAVGPALDPGSDTKARTPLAAGGGAGPATWQTFSVAGEGATLNPAAPTGLVASDLQVAIVFGAPTADTYQAPLGWSLAGSIHTNFVGGTGIDVWTAPGSAAQGTWTFSGSRMMEIHRVSGATGVRDIQMREANTFARAAGGFWLDWPNMPSPDVTAVEGDCVMSVYYGPQTAAGVGTAPLNYTRVTSRTAPNTQSTMVRSNAPAGATGVISHGVAGGAYEERASATIVLAGA